MTISVTGARNPGPALVLRLAQMRHEVGGFDTEAAPRACLANCPVPSYSPGPDIAGPLRGWHNGGQPLFATNLAEPAVAQSRVPFIGTPQSEVAHEPNSSVPVRADEPLLPPHASQSRREAI